MSVAQYHARSCSLLCSARRVGRLRHYQNPLRTGREAQGRRFYTRSSTDQASTRPVSGSSGGIGNTMLAGLKKAFTKVTQRCRTAACRHKCLAPTHCGEGFCRNPQNPWSRVLHHLLLIMLSAGRIYKGRCNSGKQSFSGRPQTWRMYYSLPHSALCYILIRLLLSPSYSSCFRDLPMLED